MKTSTDRIIARREGAMGWLIFSNPGRRNALSLDMWQAIPEVLNAYAVDPEIRVVILAGDGDKAFVSGADISQFESQRTTEDAVRHYDVIAGQANEALDGMPKPVIAMIRGFCIGGGMGVALKCDLRIAADDARFAIPAAKLGLGYRIDGMRDLVAAVGRARAKEIFFTARQFNAAEALEIGLVNTVVTASDLEAETRKVAGLIAANAPLTIYAAKRTIDAVARPDASEQDRIDVEGAIAACFASEDYREGRQAFLEKRLPQFKGR